MNRKIAFDNRLCYERDVTRQHDLHQKKLQTVLPTCQSPSRVYLDSNKPTPREHLTLNRKKQQMERDKQTEIYRQNQRLASKMEHIMHRQENAVLAAGLHPSPRSRPRPTTRGTTTREESNTSPARSPTREPKPPSTPLLSNPRSPTHSPAHVHMPGIRLDANQSPMVDCYLSPEFASGRGNACKKTTLINRAVQRQKQDRIAEENRRLQQRLQSLKPHYNTKKWDADWQQSGTKFHHLHQNGTVGYLLPRASKPAAAAAAVTTTAGDAAHSKNGRASGNHTTQSPLAARRIKSRVGQEAALPALRITTSQRAQKGDRPPASAVVRDSDRCGSATNNPGSTMSDAGSEDFQEPELIEGDSIVLLEAITRKGVALRVEELQVEMRDPASSAVQLGDRGLVVKGKWKEHTESECNIPLETLGRVAQEIDDLEMMIKLETVTELEGLGNFPRLSVLLTEDELQRLLLKLVQALNVQLLEDGQQVLIKSRFIRSLDARQKSSGGGMEGDAVADRLDRESGPLKATRPRTCPSVLASDPGLLRYTHDHYEESEFGTNDDFEYDFDDSGLEDVDAALSEQELRQFRGVLNKQLASLLNYERRRTGIRHKRSYYLVSYWFNADASRMEMLSCLVSSSSISTMDVLTTAEFMEGVLLFDADDVTAALETIQSGQVSAVEFAWEKVQEWMEANIQS